MAEYVVKVGSCSAQGRRPNNEDRFIADPDHKLFLVADGMGGQDFGEQAPGRNGALTPEQATDSAWGHVLYKFLGCVEMNDGAEVRPFAPQAGDRLLLASDGLTGHVTPDDLRSEATRFSNPQEWADHLVELAIQRGSKDNVTCVIVAFDRE